jgi:predicted transcriptional regulator
MMTVTLSDEIERLVQEKLAQGFFKSAEDLVECAVAQLFSEVDEDIEQVRAKIREGQEDIERGDVIELETDEELHAFFEEIHEQGLKRLAQSRRTGTDG